MYFMNHSPNNSENRSSAIYTHRETSVKSGKMGNLAAVVEVWPSLFFTLYVSIYIL